MPAVKRAACAVVAVAAALIGLAVLTPPAGATDPANSSVGYSVGSYPNRTGCLADVHHVTNLYGYAVAWTDNGRIGPFDQYVSCYQSAADVFYYPNKTLSGWGFFNSMSTSPYPASPTYSEHNVCTSPFLCYAPPMFGLL
jgi:hypothetical protein